MSYIFIDESGIHKRDGVSTIALVYISVANISNIDQAVLNIENKLKIEPFHWSHSSWEVRKKFIRALSKEEFSAKIAILENPFKEDLYEHALEQLITEKNVFAIIIDGKKNRFYERRMKKILRNNGISVKKLRTANDTAYPTLRIADIIAGIVRYTHDNPTEKRGLELYRLISARISRILTR